MLDDSKLDNSLSGGDQIWKTCSEYDIGRQEEVLSDVDPYCLGKVMTKTQWFAPAIS